MKVIFLTLNLCGLMAWTLIAFVSRNSWWLVMTAISFIGVLSYRAGACPKCRKYYWGFHSCKVMPRGDYVVPSRPWPTQRSPMVRDDRVPTVVPTVFPVDDSPSSFAAGLMVGSALSQKPPIPRRSAMDDISDQVDKAGLYFEPTSPSPNPAPTILENPEPTKYSSPVVDPTPTYSPDPVVPDSSPLPDPPATDASSVC